MSASRRVNGARATDRRNLVELLGHGSDRFSPTQRRLAEYVLRKYQDVAFMGVTQLASAAGVSPAAVVRFAASLDFRGYPELQRTLQKIVRSELRQGDAFAASLDLGDAEPLSERIIAQELQNLAALRANLDRAVLKQVIQYMVVAREVAVVAFRASSTLAQYLWYNLRKVKPGVQLYTAPGSVTLDDISFLDRSALVVLITFPRYSQELLEQAQFAKSRGLRTIGITNNELSPLARLCHRCLFVEAEGVSFTDFYAAPITLINVLVAEVARRLGPALTRLNQLDDLAAERGYLVPGAVPPRGL